MKNIASVESDISKQSGVLTIDSILAFPPKPIHFITQCNVYANISQLRLRLRHLLGAKRERERERQFLVSL